MSTSEIRAAIIARLVCKAPGQKLGRTALMKLMFFLQELEEIHLGYHFRLYTYGPFDSEVLSDLGTATNLNTIRERTIIHQQGYGYEISPGSHADRLSEDLQTRHPKIAERVDATVKAFGSFSAGELELRSTILFVDRELNQVGPTVTTRATVERVRQMKPHFDERTILDRVNEMQRNGLLRGLN